MAKTDNGFMTLKVELPPTGIRRVISVPSSMTLDDLNMAIQAVIGWDNSHLWHFCDGRNGPVYELPHEDDYPAFHKRLTFDALEVTLSKAFPQRGSKLTYEYDFGDSWEHTVTRMADPKVPEIACLESEGPDGMEDFGGQWRLAEFIKAMRANSDDEEWSETREWSGFDTPKAIKAFLDGESAAVKTAKLKRALKHVKVELPPPAAAKKPKKMSDEEQARTLGWMFATVVSAKVWDVLRDALANGGRCEFVDHNKTISTYLLTMFDGLKVTDGVQTPFVTNPSKLKVHKKWVEWYAAHGKEWEELRDQFDIMESYASASVRLYGAVTKDELYDIIKRYDPGIRVPQDEVMRYLEARALWTGIDYRMDGDLLVDNEAYSLDNPDADDDVRELRKVQHGIARWYPASREELFKWAFNTDYERTPEVEGVEMVLRSLCKLNDEQTEEVLDAVHDLMAGGVPPDGIYQSLVQTGLLERISTKPRQHLLDALDAWLETIHIQCLNGNTVRYLRDLEAQKAAVPKISRNAPCPCGSGKKYKLCCGKNAD